MKFIIFASNMDNTSVLNLLREAGIRVRVFLGKWENLYETSYAVDYEQFMAARELFNTILREQHSIVLFEPDLTYTTGRHVGYCEFLNSVPTDTTRDLSPFFEPTDVSGRTKMLAFDLKDSDSIELSIGFTYDPYAGVYYVAFPTDAEE